MLLHVFVEEPLASTWTSNCSFRKLFFLYWLNQAVNLSCWYLFCTFTSITYWMLKSCFLCSWWRCADGWLVDWRLISLGVSWCLFLPAGLGDMLDNLTSPPETRWPLCDPTCIEMSSSRHANENFLTSRTESCDRTSLTGGLSVSCRLLLYMRPKETNKLRPLSVKISFLGVPSACQAAVRAAVFPPAGHIHVLQTVISSISSVLLYYLHPSIFYCFVP